MDNNNNNNAPKQRKKVTREVLRRRQLSALAVIALLVLIIVVLLAKACTSLTAKEPEGVPSAGTTTTTTPAPAVEIQTTTSPQPAETVPAETTTTVTTVPAANPNLSAQVQLTKREMFLVPGDIDISYIEAYPEGSSEDNEIWETTNKDVAIVDGAGYVTAVAPGECYILLKFSNNPSVEVQIKVTVTEGSGSGYTPDNNDNSGNETYDSGNEPSYDEYSYSDDSDSGEYYEDDYGYDDYSDYNEYGEPQLKNDSDNTSSEHIETL